MRTALLAVSILASVVGCDAKSSLAEEKTAIINLLQSSNGNATSEMNVDPVIVRTKYGIADWVQGDKGGRALLQKEHGTWKVVTMAGEDLRDAGFLAQAGVPQTEAKALANTLIATERRVPEERLAKFDHYAAVVSR